MERVKKVFLRISLKEFHVWDIGFCKDSSTKETEFCSDKGGNAVTELLWMNGGKE
jgi:hypothetical protein